MSTTTVDRYPTFKVGNSNIVIRPFVNQESDNMGLTRYGMTLHEGIMHEEPMVCLETVNGMRRYKNGLNEFAPEVKLLPNDERASVIKEIRTIVAQIERELAANVLDIDDVEFWNKVKICKHDNDAFWGSIILRMGNDPIYLSPATDTHDLIKVRAIQHGGFSLIAPSLEAARSMPVPPKFYLDMHEQTASVLTEVKKLRNKAGQELQKMFDKNVNKLMFVAKVVDINSMQYRKSTPADVMYDNLDKYINGELEEKNKRKTAQRFLEIAALDPETLKVRAMVKDATYYKIIAPRGDGMIYHLSSGTPMGKNPSDVAEYLKNPMNEDIFKAILGGVEKYWNA